MAMTPEEASKWVEEQKSKFLEPKIEPLFKKTICKRLSLTPYRFEKLKTQYNVKPIGRIGKGNKYLYDYYQWLRIIDNEG